MALTDSALKALKPRATAYKVTDEKGLYVQVTPAGGKLWKLKFRNKVGAEKKLSLGAYPEISLKEARELRDAARSNLAKGVDPAEQKQRDKRAAMISAANSFEAVAKAYIAKNKRDGLAEATVRKREWSEFDLEGAVWRIPAAKMKGRQEHAVPLARQSVAILREAQELTGDGQFVFPSIRSPRNPMSENTVNAALRRLGFGKDEMTAHGFRAMASTLLNESGKWSSDAIERALVHKDKDHVRAAYHRGTHWQERVEMAQWWADYLDSLRSSGEVVPILKGTGR
jgi:integrase